MLLRPRALSSETRPNQKNTSMHCNSQLHHGLSSSILAITVLSKAESTNTPYSQVAAMSSMMSDYTGVAEPHP